jgi:hypothetical protein
MDRTTFGTTWARRDATRIRLGMLCLLASGVLTVVGLTLRGPIVDPARFPAEFVAVSTSGTHYLAWSLLLPSLVIQCFGWLALYHWLRDSREERLAFWGTMLSIAGNLFFLPSVGVLAFLSEVASKAHAAGSPDALALVTAGIQGPFALPFLMGSGLTLLAGVVLFTVVLWRTPKLPRWIAPLYALHAVFLTVTAPQFQPWGYRLEKVGGALLLVVTAVIVARVWRDTANAAADGRAAPAAASR